MTEITYTVPVDGSRERESYTTNDVADNRAAWNPMLRCRMPAGTPAKRLTGTQVSLTSRPLRLSKWVSHTTATTKPAARAVGYEGLPIPHRGRRGR